MTEVTPPGGAAPHIPNSHGRKPPRRIPQVDLGSLNDPATFRGYATHDLISGLHGICVVLDNALVDNAEFENHHGTMCDLAIAAKVLSSILYNEVHS